MVYSLVLKYKFEKDYWADYACQSISADPEPRPQIIERIMTFNPDGTLQVEFRSANLKLIRTACSAIMEYVGLTAETFDKFDPQLNPSLY